MNKQEYENIGRSFNRVEGFWKHQRKDGWFIYNGRCPISNCIVIPNGNSVEIHNFIVFADEDRGKGNGMAMIADIRKAFPNKLIWTDTCTHARPFWEKMIEYGFIDSIENDYPWPCMDTTCTICHPSRIEGRRRVS